MRPSWSPLWADVLGIRPWEMDDLTAAEFDAAHAYLGGIAKQRQRAAEDRIRGAAAGPAPDPGAMAGMVMG